MACGLPLLCSDIPAHRELVPPEVWDLVPPGDAPAWAAAITAVLRDPVTAGRRGAQARALAVARYDFGSNLDRMAEFIARIAAEGDGRARSPRLYAGNV
jgi:glycosyltransferase involved in cell wall biosynthesis